VCVGRLSRRRIPNIESRTPELETRNPKHETTNPNSHLQTPNPKPQIPPQVRAIDVGSITLPTESQSCPEERDWKGLPRVALRSIADGPVGFPGRNGLVARSLDWDLAVDAKLWIEGADSLLVRTVYVHGFDSWFRLGCWVGDRL